MKTSTPAMFFSRQFEVSTAALIACVYLAFVAVNAQAAPLGNCSIEPALSARPDVVMCEPWETESWWSDHGYVRDGAKVRPVPVAESQMEYASIIADGCLSGNCMQLETPLGVTRSLSIHWPLAAAGLEPEELYFRYYFKIGSDWTPEQCSSPGNTVWPPSGKFPGFGDPRSNLDPGGQCGNGGAEGNGIDCWTARAVFQGCEGNYASNGFPYDNTCEQVPNARVRIGSYLYLPNTGETHGANGLWDNVAERNSLGGNYSSACRRDDPDNPDPDCYCKDYDNMHCGIGTGGQLVTDRWYAIETYIKMNTPGQDDGIIRGWVDDVLSYEKTNARFRLPGHDNLHIRTLWLDTYKGGVNGNCQDGFLYYDQMVVAQQKIGLLDTGPPDLTPPSTPQNLSGVAVSESEISLSWNAASDPDSFVSSYQIYRDGQPIQQHGSTTFNDTELDDNVTYSYQVAALNRSGVEGSKSSALDVTTIADVTAPTITFASASGTAPVVTLLFSEPLDVISAESVGNYTINNGISISDATLDDDEQTVRLATSSLSEGVSYTVTVNGVSDQATSSNEIGANSAIDFEYIPSLAGSNTSPAAYSWDVLGENQLVYVDRSFTYTNVGSFAGFDYLKTENDDKSKSGDPFLTFDIARESIVYIGYDNRIGTLPDWLSDWVDTGAELENTDTIFHLYKKTFSAGQVNLGGNEYGNSMYMVMVGPVSELVNSRPVAVNDSTITNEDVAVQINVLANDSGLADAPVILSIASAPPNGTAAPKDGEIEYTPDTGFVGQDVFSYRVTDSDGDMATATVTVSVSPGNAGGSATPSATNDQRQTLQNTTIDVDVVANDAGLDDAPITLSITTVPSNGTASVLDSQTIRYTPNAGYLGLDSLVYQVTDVDGDSSQAVLTIVVNSSADDQPIAIADSVNTDENTAVNIDVLLNDFGLSDVPVTLSVVAQPSNGSAAVNGLNIIYTPIDGFSGSDSFAYSVIDQSGDGAQATVTITVNPVATTDGDSGGGGAPHPLTISLGFLFVALSRKKNQKNIGI